MRYALGGSDPVFSSIEAVVRGLSMGLVELSVSRHKGSVRVMAVICGPPGGGTVGIDDCARAHRAIQPRLELAFPKQNIHVEVSSPGTGRRIKDGAEFAHYLGQTVSCYRPDAGGWTSGILASADDTGIVIKEESGMTSISYGEIAKARLGALAPVAERKAGAAV
ncbi:MAG: ribosome assembly cofactor RimP [Spirochaetaceae bacterium]|jgi:ribosome maturation factor RimP|nr:ribosome assembly cofactor RimP [Spirochaetaceae bacterium]